MRERSIDNRTITIAKKYLPCIIRCIQASKLPSVKKQNHILFFEGQSLLLNMLFVYKSIYQVVDHNTNTFQAAEIWISILQFSYLKCYMSFKFISLYIQYCCPTAFDTVITHMIQLVILTIIRYIPLPIETSGKQPKLASPTELLYVPEI